MMCLFNTSRHPDGADMPTQNHGIDSVFYQYVYQCANARKPTLSKIVRYGFLNLIMP